MKEKKSRFCISVKGLDPNVWTHFKALCALEREHIVTRLEKILRREIKGYHDGKKHT